VVVGQITAAQVFCWSISNIGAKIGVPPQLTYESIPTTRFNGG
jgi:hypothetical protein